jgi:hypothetical protein
VQFGDEFATGRAAADDHKRKETSSFCLRDCGDGRFLERVNNVVSNTSSMMELLQKENILPFLDGRNAKSLRKSKSS